MATVSRRFYRHNSGYRFNAIQTKSQTAVVRLYEPALCWAREKLFSIRCLKTGMILMLVYACMHECLSESECACFSARMCTCLSCLILVKHTCMHTQPHTHDTHTHPHTHAFCRYIFFTHKTLCRKLIVIGDI